MDLPENIKYTEDHEWAKLDGDISFTLINILYREP